jgi:plasmid maintenance system antidote protein VapI
MVPPKSKLAPIHPGEVLLEDFLDLLGLSPYRLAQDLTGKWRRVDTWVWGACRMGMMLVILKV